MGAEGVGEGTAAAEMGAGGAEEPTAPGAPRRRARALASLFRFFSFSTTPAPRSDQEVSQ